MVRSAVDPCEDWMIDVEDLTECLEVPLAISFSLGEGSSTTYALKPTVGPSGFEVEENSKSNGGSDDGNEGRAHDIAPFVGNVVIGYPLLAKVVHATDSSASQDANSNDSTKVDFFGKAQEVESDTHNTDWKKERSSGAAGAVTDLEFAFPMNHGDGTITNEMHGPDSDSSHGDGSAYE
ncbi:MAG: hypothetical protein LQ350_005123 [Teloschistes chrysophthalmus]|nr:MAG: hypothetical protein LQ350_005123 [Niorma chrysophthalma]